MLHRAVLSIFRKPTGWENESMISAIPVESFFSAFIFHLSFMLEISLLNCLWQFFTLPEKNIYHFSVLHQKPAKITRKAWLLVGPMRTQQKMSENDDVASYFFLHETCENKKFLSILEKGKQTREICRYSILNSEPGACNSWWVCNWVHFLCVILTSNLSLHSLCWLLSYKEKWEVRWQEMQPLKLTFHSCFCHKRTKTLWDITP